VTGPGALVATLREFLERTGALGATAVLDRGADAEALVVECRPEGWVVTDPAGEEVGLSDAELGAAPLDLPGDLRPLPGLSVDTVSAELSAPIGVVDAMGTAARDLAARLPGRSAVTVEWATDQPDLPLVVAARPGDPLVLALGEELFEMPAGWP